MKKKLHTINLTEEDLNFAKEISEEFGFSLNEISWFIQELRQDVQSDHVDECHILYKDESDRLMSDQNIDLMGLEITNNRGKIKIDKSDLLYDYFYRYIERKRKKTEKFLLSENKRINTIKFKNEYPYHKIVIFFARTSLILNQKYIGIGKFLVHFQLYGNKPLMTEKEYNENPTDSAQDYKHYLTERVRSRVKKILPYYSI